MQILFAFLLAATSLAASTITTVTLLDAGRPVVRDGRHSVGPYTLRIEGRTLSALCIDLPDQTGVGRSWNAYLNSFGDDLAYTYHPADAVTYAEEAYLYTRILQPGADRIAIQQAAWALTDSDIVPGADAMRWMLRARQDFNEIDLKHFVIVSEVPGRSCSRAQEFVAEIPIPEPALIGLAAGLVLTALAPLFRRQL